MNKARGAASVIVVSCLALGGCGGDRAGTATEKSPAVSPVTVYVGEADELLAPILAAYSDESGVPVRHAGNREATLRELLAKQAGPSSVDLLLFVDAAVLAALAADGLLRPVFSDILEAAVPDVLRDPDDMWFGLAYGRATIAYDAHATDPAGLSSFDALAAEEWRGKLCMVTSGAPHSRALLAAMIANRGERTAERIVRGWIANLAMPVVPDDQALLEAITSGQCVVGFVDSRHAFAASGDAIGVFIPAGDPAAPFRVSGAAVTRHSRNADGATALLEWLSSPQASELLSGGGAGSVATAAIARQMPGGATVPLPAEAANILHTPDARRAAARMAERARYP